MGRLAPRFAIMNSFSKMLQDFVGEDVAATAVEYAVVLMLIAGMCITAIQFVGGPLEAFFLDSQEQFENAVNQGESS